MTVFSLLWCTSDPGPDFPGSRVSCFCSPGAGQSGRACAVAASGLPLDQWERACPASMRGSGHRPAPHEWGHACPARLAVLAVMAAASLPAWLCLQPGARALRAFSTAVSPTALPGKTGPRECLPRPLRALGEGRGRNIRPVKAAEVEPAPPRGGRGVSAPVPVPVPGPWLAWWESRACGCARCPGVAPFLAAGFCAGASARHQPARPSLLPSLRAPRASVSAPRSPAPAASDCAR